MNLWPVCVEVSVRSSSGKYSLINHVHTIGDLLKCTNMREVMDFK